MICGANRCLTIKTKEEMKKNLFMVAAVALMVFTACNKEEINVEAGASVGTIEFVAGFDADTKTTLKAGKTEWVAGDEISINGVKFVAQNDGPTSTFLNAEEPAEDFGAPFTAVYPYGADGVPAAQTAYAGNFDPQAVVETATSDDHNLSFKNESSLLKFQVSAACKTVTLTSDTELAKGSKTVTITGSFVAGTDYYAAVLPGTKTNFSVEADGWVSRSADEVSINRTSIVNMGTVKAPGDWIMTGELGDIHMVKSDTYTELYVAKNVALASGKSFRFQSKDKTKTIGAYGTSGTVDCKGQINSWYDSDAKNTYAANISISSAGNYDVYFSPTDLNFLIIKAGVEEANSEWALVGYIGGDNLWNSTANKLKYNYILCETSITIALTSSDYFKFIKNNNWNTGNVNSGYIAGVGTDDNGVSDLDIDAGKSLNYETGWSWGDRKTQFRMTKNGTYKIVLAIADNSNPYSAVTVKFTRIK